MRFFASAAALIALVLTTPAARADDVADFYRGKTVRLVIGYGPGGGYDLYGRLAVEFLGRHIPGNPTLVPVNMPGAGGMRAAAWLYEAAPQDGTALGTVAQGAAMQVVTDAKLKLDPTRMHYIGRLTSNIDVAVALPAAGVKSFADALDHEVVVGADSGSRGVVFARTLDQYAGAKLKLVTGYNGSADVALAAERGEVQVNGSYSLPAVLTSHPDWVRDGKAVILYQNAIHRFVELPQVPTVLELVQSDEGRSLARVIAGTAEIGRAILATPGVPPERLEALRAAFAAMLKDPDFLAAAAARHMMLDPASGETLDAITAETMNLPPPMVEKLREILKGSG